MLRTALVISDDRDKSEGIIDALESEHSIWNVARQRDAMAYMAMHRPDTVVIDLDMPSLDVGAVLDAIRNHEQDQTLVIGICASPSSIPESIALRIDQLVNTPIRHG